MRVFVLVTLSEGNEELLGIFTTPALAEKAWAEVARKRRAAMTRFGYYAATLDGAL
jgi:hypothetical protein